MRMLRAISEIAAAITVWSPLEKPASAARSRPRCRAVTTSVSAVIGIRRSSATVDASRPALDAELRLLVEEQQAFLEIQRGGHALEREAELDHGEGDLGLNPDDHRLRAAQPRHVRDVPQRAHRKRVHHVERRDVDDHAPGPEAPDARSEEHTSELQSRGHLVCRLLPEKKNAETDARAPRKIPMGVRSAPTKTT